MQRKNVTNRSVAYHITGYACFGVCPCNHTRQMENSDEPIVHFAYLGCDHSISLKALQLKFICIKRDNKKSKKHVAGPYVTSSFTYCKK